MNKKIVLVHGQKPPSTEPRSKARILVSSPSEATMRLHLHADSEIIRNIRLPEIYSKPCDETDAINQIGTLERGRYSLGGKQERTSFSSISIPTKPKVVIVNEE